MCTKSLPFVHSLYFFVHFFWHKLENIANSNDRGKKLIVDTSMLNELGLIKFEHKHVPLRNNYGA
jgi:hypothetical protein